MTPSPDNFQDVLAVEDIIAMHVILNYSPDKTI